MPEDKLTLTKVPIFSKKRRSLHIKLEKVAIRSTYILRSRIVSQKSTEGKEKGPLFMKELRMFGLGLGVCLEKPITPILFFDSSSSNEGGVGPSPGQCPAFLVPYSDSKDEIVIATPLSVIRPSGGGYSMADKAQ